MTAEKLIGAFIGKAFGNAIGNAIQIAFVVFLWEHWGAIALVVYLLAKMVVTGLWLAVSEKERETFVR